MQRPNYDSQYWCANCKQPINHEDADEMCNGAPKCPKCGRRLRVGPRIKSKPLPILKYWEPQE